MMIAAILMGANPGKAKPELYETLKFETELAKVSGFIHEKFKISTNEVPKLRLFQISLRIHERQSEVISNEFSIKTLQETFPYIDWRDYINWNMNNAIIIDDDEVLFVPDVNYFHQLNKLIERTPKRTVANVKITPFSLNFLILNCLLFNESI